MVLKRFMKSLDFRLQCWVWKKIKLHGTQTTTIPKPRRCTVWKRKKLQETQTRVKAIDNWLAFWRRVKLQGSQIFCEEGNGVHAIGKGIELQGAQTTPPSEANKAMFWKRKNCRVLKLHPFRLTYGDRFRRR